MGKGAGAGKRAVEAFVDEEAGPEVAEKVRRRLQHVSDRKVAAQFEPLLAMGRDEALTGLARGFAFRLTEALGVIPRDGIANDVKALDQDSRGALRTTGIAIGPCVSVGSGAVRAAAAAGRAMAPPTLPTIST